MMDLCSHRRPPAGRRTGMDEEMICAATSVPIRNWPRCQRQQPARDAAAEPKFHRAKQNNNAPFAFSPFLVGLLCLSVRLCFGAWHCVLVEHFAVKLNFLSKNETHSSSRAPRSCSELSLVVVSFFTPEQKMRQRPLFLSHHHSRQQPALVLPQASNTKCLSSSARLLHCLFLSTETTTRSCPRSHPRRVAAPRTCKTRLVLARAGTGSSCLCFHLLLSFVDSNARPPFLIVIVVVVVVKSS